MALGSGSIAFVGINTSGTDWFAIVALQDIAAGETIYFTDNELATSSSITFNGAPTGGESYLKWTAPAGGIAAGSIVNFTSIPASPTVSGNTSVAASVGTLTAINNFSGSLNTGLSNGQESLYAYTAAGDGTADTPTAQLAFISNGTAADPAPQSLAADQQIAFTTGEDAAYYTGSHSDQTSFAAYLDEINNPANWTKVAAGTTNASLDTTPFTIAQTVGFASGSVSVSHAEGDTGTTDFTFTIQRTGGTTGQVDFSGTVSAGATDAADFGGTLPTSFSGSIAAGQSSATVTIHVSGDVSIESDESFTLTLTDATNVSFPVSLGTTGATGTIQDDDATQGIDLSHYVRVARYALPEPTTTVPPDSTSLLAQEASAVTYNWDTDTLFVVGDGGTSVVQVSKTGELINSMTLAPGGSPQGTEFYDTEGLTYVGNGEFVMTEERYRQAVLFTYDAGGTLTRDETQTVKLGTTIGNTGLEGVTYDPETNGFIFVKEISPESIFQTNIDFDAGTATNGSATADGSTDLFNPALAGLNDFSDVYSLANLQLLNGQPDSSHLLILSQESGKVVEVDRAGNIYSTLTLAPDAGDSISIPDMTIEGVTMDSAGNLYVVNENGGGDAHHPQLWVYSRSTATNLAPTALALNNQVNSLPENTSTAARYKVADVAITDDGLGTNNLSLSGADAAYFQVDSTGLYIKAGTVLDFETKNSYAVTVNVDDPSVGGPVDASASFSLNLTDVVNETPGLPVIFISEVAPWSSGNSTTLKADWFEVTNSGTVAVNISGWKMDDNSNSFGSAVGLNGVTSIAPGESVIFIETTDASAATLNAAKTLFANEWFNGTLPAGLQIGSYSGNGVGLSTGGDAVNLYTSGGALVTNVTFGVSPGASPFTTFDNTAGVDGAAITRMSATGQNSAFSVTHGATTEIGSPGTVGKLFISEVAPWSSGNSPVGADWFEVTNTTTSAIDISGWRVDDSSNSFGSSLALNGITSIAAGESVIFIETGNGQTAAGNAAAFLSAWFGNNPPANLQIGNYTGSGIGLSTGGDALNLYNAAGVLQANVVFGANAGSLGTPPTLLQTFDNAAGLNNATISQLSLAGQNSAYGMAHAGATEIGSPGEITPVNHAPIAGDDSLSSIAEDSGTRAISFASLTGNDLAGLPNESGQTLTITNVSNAVGGTVSIVGTNVMFAPRANYNGPASFDYTVQDNGTTYGAPAFLTDVGSASFAITAVNDAPVAGDDSLTSIGEDSGDRTISFASLLGNDSTGPANESGQNLTITGVSNAVGGSVSIVGTDVIFTPGSNFNGTASFDYTVQDDGTTNGANDFRTDTGSVSFTVTPVNDAPGFTSSSAFTVQENHTSVGTVTASDVEGNGFTFAITGGSDAGFFSIGLNSGALNFNATPDFETAEDSGGDHIYDLTVTVTDTLGASSQQAISVTVTDLNEPGSVLTGKGKNAGLNGGTGNDTINGTSGNDALAGGDGNDVISGSNGNDVMDGGRGNDVLDGGIGNDSVHGGIGNDALTGGTGDDSLFGDAGNDILTGSEGKDVLTGGAGADIFVFGAAKAADADRITDFETGIDTLQFSAAAYGLPAGAVDAAHFVAGAAAVDHHAEFIYNAATKTLLWDADGIGGKAAVAIATFDTAVALTNSDLILV